MTRKGIANHRRSGRTGGVRASRLASLTALSAAAVAAGGHAEAAIIYSGPLNDQIGFDTGSAPLSLALPPGSAAASSLARIGLYTRRRTSTIVAGSHKIRTGTRSVTANGVAFKVGGTLLALVGKGQTFNQVGTKRSSAGARVRIGGQRSTRVSVSGVPASSSVDRHPNVTKSTGFALFSFDAGGGKTDYGWLDLSLIFGPEGPDVTVLGYAYDDSGVHIEAGDTGTAAVPEPSSAALELSGLAALVLGAAGMRRWRAARGDRAAA